MPADKEYIHSVSPFSVPVKIDACLTLPHRVMLAPMHGVMNPVFIGAVDEMSLAPVAVSPFLSISTKDVPSKRVLKKALLPWRNTPERLRIVQIMGQYPSSMAETAYRLAEIGFPYVNVNFACPAPAVVRSGHGGYCLKDPLLMASVLKEMIRVCGNGISLSVKVRTGWDSPSETPVIAGTIADCGVRLVIVHFRTVREMYSPVSDPLPRLEAFRKAAPDMVIFGNGDIETPQDADRMIRETGCDGVAVARGFMRNPFLIRDILAEPPVPGIDCRPEFLQCLRQKAVESGRWRKNVYLEWVKLSYGGNSPQFLRLLPVRSGRDSRKAALPKPGNIPSNRA